MANSKISALTSATTPLVGTETLPIVQGGVTVKTTVADITNGGGYAGSFTTLASTGNTTLGDADTDTITQAASYVTGTQLKSAKTATNTLNLAAYDVDGTAYTNLITLTASNTPTLTLTSTGVGTINNMSIGATTASTGAFTTLSATGNTTLGDATTDTVTVNGYMGVGGAAVSSGGIRVTSTALTSNNQHGIISLPTITSGATTSGNGVSGRVSTEATAFTVANLHAFYAFDAIKGAGSTITNQHGLYIVDQTQGTNNYGITSTVTSGANKYNIYASGTAQNYFSGNVLIFGAGGLGYATGSGGTVTQATSRTTGVTLNKTNGAITLVSAAGLATFQSFTVTNSTVAATDVVHVTQKSGTDLYQIFVTATAAGSFRITFATTGGITVEQPVFNFAIVKAVTA